MKRKKEKQEYTQIIKEESRHIQIRVQCILLHTYNEREKEKQPIGAFIQILGGNIQKQSISGNTRKGEAGKDREQNKREKACGACRA